MKNVIRIALVLLTFGMLTACGDDDNTVFVKQVTVYGTTVGTDDLGTSDLVILNSSTGALVRIVGDVGFYVNGLAYDKTTGKLFATTSANDPVFPAGLIEINPVTGAGTPIGLGTGLAAAATLTIDSAGQLYTWSEPSDDDLAVINKVTGVATVVGDSGLSTATLGLDFDAFGTLFLVNDGGETYAINPLTGGSVFVGDLGVTAHHGKFHPITGDFIGIDIATSDPLVPERSLVVADLSTFTVLDVVPTVDYLHSIAFVTKLVAISQ